MHWSKGDKRLETLQKIKVGWINIRPKKKTGKNIDCPVCGTSNYFSCARIKRGGRFCNKKCLGQYKASQPEDFKSRWKGEKVGYSGLHHWIKKHKGRPGPCEHCGSEGRNQWANIDHKYKRELNKYISLCSSCHKKYDLKML